MLRDAMLEKARAQLGHGNLARLAVEVAEHKRDPYTLVEEIAAKANEHVGPDAFVRAVLQSNGGARIPPRRHQRGMSPMFQIDHLGIAVKSLAAAKTIYEKLGLSISPEETVEQEQVRVVMVPVGESRLELLEATSETSTIAKFIAKRGEGLHHLCLKVPDLPAAVEQLKKDGVRLVSDQIKTGAGGHQYVFVHPSSAGGVLLELVQE